MPLTAQSLGELIDDLIELCQQLAGDGSLSPEDRDFFRWLMQRLNEIQLLMARIDFTGRDSDVLFINQRLGRVNNTVQDIASGRETARNVMNTLTNLVGAVTGLLQTILS